MLGQDYYMERFVNELTKINRGRAFFTSPDNIGDYIWWTTSHEPTEKKIA